MIVPDELRALYPGLSEEDLIEAKENLDRYILLAWEIMEDQSEGTPSIDGHDDHL
jgi:hypothetical protein